MSTTVRKELEPGILYLVLIIHGHVSLQFARTLVD